MAGPRSPGTAEPDVSAGISPLAQSLRTAYSALAGLGEHSAMMCQRHSGIGDGHGQYRQSQRTRDIRDRPTRRHLGRLSNSFGPRFPDVNRGHARNYV